VDSLVFENTAKTYRSVLLGSGSSSVRRASIKVSILYPAIYFHRTSKDLSLINKSNSVGISHRLKKNIRREYTCTGT